MTSRYATHPALRRRTATDRPVVVAYITRSRRGVLRGCVKLGDSVVVTGVPRKTRQWAWRDAQDAAAMVRAGLDEEFC